jgi:TonB family protein
MSNMKSAAALLSLFVATALFAQQHLSQSSSDWDLTIGVQRTVYDVRLTDRNTNGVAAEWHLPNNGKTVEGTVDNASGHYTLRLDPGNDGPTVHATMKRNGARRDWMIVFWNLASVRRQDPGVAPLRVGGDVKAPIAIERAEPQYSEEAKTARDSGIVILEVEIDKSGVVRKVIVLKRLPHGLAQSAIDAVRQWRWKPATLNEQPVDAIYDLTISFKLDEPAGH